MLRLRTVTMTTNYMGEISTNKFVGFKRAARKVEKFDKDPDSTVLSSLTNEISVKTEHATLKEVFHYLFGGFIKSNQRLKKINEFYA